MKTELKSAETWRRIDHRDGGAAVPAALREWVLDSGSLTQRLRDACMGGDLEVQLLGQRHERPLRNERLALSMKDYGHALVRQVILSCGGRPWVFARTVIPGSTLRGDGRILARLGRRPLGEMLFSHRAVVRGELEIARLLPHHRLYGLAVTGMEARPDEIWGRRSVFSFNGRPLLVSEWFLPELGCVVPVSEQAA